MREHRHRLRCRRAGRARERAASPARRSPQLHALKPSPSLDSERAADETARDRLAAATRPRSGGAIPATALPASTTAPALPPLSSKPASASHRWPQALALSVLIHGGLLAAAQWLPARWLAPAPAVPEATAPGSLAIFVLDASSNVAKAPGAVGETRQAGAEPTAAPTAQATADTEATMHLAGAAADEPAGERGSEAPAAPTPLVETGLDDSDTKLASAPVRPPRDDEPAAAPRDAAKPATAPATPGARAPAPARPPEPVAAAPAAGPAATKAVPAPTPLPGPAQPPPRTGLASLDAEIAAARRREQAAAQPAPAPTDAKTDAELTGLAALDAEIAAARAAARPQEQRRSSRDGGSTRASASPTPAGKPHATDPAARGRAEHRYLGALRRALERERHYPLSARRGRLEGTARVQFTIAADGVFSAIHVSRSAGTATLDEAAADTVRRLGRFDPIPAVIGRSRWTVQVPIVFRLN